MAVGSNSSEIAVLTGRERQVLEMAARGLTNLQIAHELHVTIHAIKFHLASAFRKLGASNRTDAAVRFLQVEAAAVAEKELG